MVALLVGLWAAAGLGGSIDGIGTAMLFLMFGSLTMRMGRFSALAAVVVLSAVVRKSRSEVRAVMLALC